ncbi:hypothetical protein [Roseisalinus antarcticus]|uniref:Uncharacterized protein n=1 Tax=Roseisalinus antarcticus TaxID=254357 RepID=A0A1Y5RBU1_9RHOB|nr:hypothetical protein [Roseisalinus antarcticus]SLN13008.1 hypothetical protein ROA7023_00023 [Roseisalinus antarcticus]
MRAAAGSLLLLALAQAPAAPAGAEPLCTDLPRDVRVCADSGVLAPASAQTGGPALFYHDTLGATVEVAPLSATATTDPALMRPALDAYLAAERGMENGLPVLRTDRIDLGDRAAEQVVYQITAPDGATTTIADTLALGDGFGIFVQTFDAGAGFSPLHSAFHDAVLAALALPPPAEPDSYMMRANRPDPRPLDPLTTEPME